MLDKCVTPLRQLTELGSDLIRGGYEFMREGDHFMRSGDCFAGGSAGFVYAEPYSQKVLAPVHREGLPPCLREGVQIAQARQSVISIPRVNAFLHCTGRLPVSNVHSQGA